MEILLKRAYEEAEAEDGFRVLVDRLWPRGKKKADLRLDGWIKIIAPSTKLRKWFGHDPKRWLEFCKRYKKRVKESRGAGTITQTVYAAGERNAITLVSMSMISALRSSRATDRGRCGAIRSTKLRRLAADPSSLRRAASNRAEGGNT